MIWGISRRSLIGSGAACVGAALLGGRASSLLASEEERGAESPIRLQAVMRTLEVNGKSATLMGLRQSNGQPGLVLPMTQPFDVTLENQLAVPTAIHWHGLHPPNNQDGVPGLTQSVIKPGASARYDFPLRPSGTHWMHSHEGLQEAFLLSAPLIVHDKSGETKDEQEVVVFLGDFSFTPPTEIYDKLIRPRKAMSTSESKTGGEMKKMSMGKPDANDVDYDAYLANDRTLGDPDVVRVEKNGKVRLRIINGSSGTNFFISLGDLKGEVIATDGMRVEPVSGSTFPLAIAQRIDVRVQLPQEGAFPILALREGAREQTGIILATPGAPIKKLSAVSGSLRGLLNLDFENRLIAAEPLEVKPVDRSFDLRLTGNMMRYEWTINGIAFDTKKPSGQPAQVHVKQGQRVAVRFINETGMSHPMHLHGHSFQVTEINGQPQKGALRDTLLVTPKTSVTVAFDANNPGTWYLHCHVLWHLAAGMATLVEYEA
jgi:FtsP/CotA-like multicopper oxidase with cupredoxin domain